MGVTSNAVHKVLCVLAVVTMLAVSVPADSLYETETRNDPTNVLERFGAPAATQEAESFQCDASDPVPAQMERAGLVEYSIEPDGGTWQPWFVAPGELEIPPPPDTASQETAEELAEIRLYELNRTNEQVLRAQSWDEGPATSGWTDLYLNLIVEHADKNADRNPPRLAREMAIMHTAMYDALIATWAAKYCYMRPAPYDLDPTLDPAVEERPLPSYPSEHAAVAGVAKVILREFFSEDEEPAGTLEATASEAAESRVIAGANYRSDVDVGFSIGEEVAERVLEARADDGWDEEWDGSGRIEGPCRWIPTPTDNEGHGFGGPLEPAWGDVRPFIMESGDQFRAPPPPACDGEDYTAQYRDVYEASKILTDRQKEISDYWEAGQGTVTPPGMNLEIAQEKALENELNTLRAARVMAYVSVAVADAGIAAWDSKYHYWWDRPIITIRRLGWDTQDGLCDDIGEDPHFEYGGCWLSHAVTPPFPGYVSGHSTFTGAGQETLKYFFPDDEEEFRAYQTEAAMSRFYGGIHFRHDNDQGVEVGIEIGHLLHARALEDGADAVRDEASAT